MKKHDDLIRKMLAAPNLNGAYSPRYGGRQGVEKRNWSFDPKATNGELRLLKRGLGKRRKKKVIERERKPKPVKQQRPSRAACKVGDCSLNDHVMFNVGKVTIDGHVHKVKQTRFGRRFYVRPVLDCRKYGRGWILGFATPVLKLSACAAIAALCAMSSSAQEQSERSGAHKRSIERSSSEYILRRQESGAVQGVPTSRRIIGRREIDVYSNGLMFEKDNLIGIER